MELISLFNDYFECVPVSWRAQGSSWLFCTQQFRVVLCLSPEHFRTLSLCTQSVLCLGCSPGQWEMLACKSVAEGSVSLEVGTPGLT